MVVIRKIYMDEDCVLDMIKKWNIRWVSKLEKIIYDILYEYVCDFCFE